MAKLRFIQRAERVLRLLMGLRNERIARALVAHGLGGEDVAEGFALLRRCTRATLDFAPEPLATSAAARVEVEAWERRWLPIAKATLRRRAPAAAAWMFGEGGLKAPEIAVGLLVRRWEALGESRRKGGLGAEGVKARQLLEQRGLTAERIAAVKDALARATALPGGAGDGGGEEGEAEETAGAFAEAEKDLWGWYLEWSAIARAAIADRRLLRAMGFLRGGRRGEGEEEAEAPGNGDGAAKGGERREDARKTSASAVRKSRRKPA